MNNDQIKAVLDNSRTHAADLLEAADFMRAMLTKQPLTETLAHYEALAARLQARGAMVQDNIGGLI